MKRFAMMLVVMFAVGCGNSTDPWSFRDPIVINTETDEQVDEPDSQVDDPDREPADRLERVERPDYVEPSVSPILCDADFDSYTVPARIEGTLRNGRGSVDELPCARAMGQEARYRIVVEERTGVRIWMTYRTTEFSPVLLLQKGCGDNTIDAFCSSPLHAHPEEASANIQAVLEPGEYTLVVDERSSFDYGEGGDFVIHVDELELAANAVCEAAPTLVPGEIPHVEDGTRGATGDLSTCFPGSFQQYWTVMMPPNSGARVRAEYDDPEISQDPYLRLSQSCSEHCDGAGEYGTISIANPAAERVPYVVAVSNFRQAPFRLWVEGFTPLAENIACETAAEVEPDRTVEGDPIQASPHVGRCGGDDQRQLYYEIDVPPNHRLLTDAQGTHVTIQESCGAMSCQSSVVNRSNETKTYLLTTGTGIAYERPFTFVPRVVGLAENASCENARPLELGQTEWAYSYRGGEQRGPCSLVFAEGFTHWYSVSIPPGETHELEVDRHEGPALNVEVIDGGCAGTCGEHWDAYFHGLLDPKVEISNEQDVARDVLVAVTNDGEAGTTISGYYTVTVNRVMEPQ